MNGRSRRRHVATAAARSAPTHASVSVRGRAATRAANRAFRWTVGFVALHGYWALGGRVGFGDQPDPLPPAPTSVGSWLFTAAVVAMFAAGLATPRAFTQPWGRRLPRRLLVASMWIGCAVLAARGASGFLDDFLRFSGLADRGLTGLTNEQVLGHADPSASTIYGTLAIDAIFVTGGLLFGYAARLAGSSRAAAHGA